MIGAVLKLIIFTSMVNRIINTSRNERVTQQVYDTYLQMFDVCTLRHTAHIEAIVFRYGGHHLIPWKTRISVDEVCVINVTFDMISLCVITRYYTHYSVHISPIIHRPYIYSTVMCRLTTGIRSEKCVFMLFRRRANVIECTYTNLDSKA